MNSLKLGQMAAQHKLITSISACLYSNKKPSHKHIVMVVFQQDMYFCSICRLNNKGVTYGKFRTSRNSKHTFASICKWVPQVALDLLTVPGSLNLISFILYVKAIDHSDH